MRKLGREEVKYVPQEMGVRRGAPGLAVAHSLISIRPILRYLLLREPFLDHLSHLPALLGVTDWSVCQFKVYDVMI